MASAIIDRAALAVLVQTAIGSITGVPHVPQRRPDPSLPAWCRLLSVGLKRWPRTLPGTGTPDETEEGDALVRVEVGVGRDYENAYALEAAAMKVVAVLHEQRLAESGTGDATHGLVLRCAEDGDVTVDQERSIETTVLVFEGEAQRLGGTSLLDLLN